MGKGKFRNFIVYFLIYLIMKTRPILLSILLIFTVPAITNAQVGNLLRNKVGRVVNAGAKVLSKEADKKIDSAATKEAEKAVAKSQADKARQDSIDKANSVSETGTDTNIDKGTRTGQSGRSGINLGGLMGGGKVTSKYNESYSYNNRIYTEMEMYDKKDVTKMNYFIYFNTDNANAGFESKMVATSEEGQQTEVTSTFIFDGDNKSFIIMTDMGGMRLGIISEVPEEGITESQATDANTKPTITKTGNTRMIAGYKCDEYQYTDNDTKEHGKIWATRDLRLTADKRTFSKAGLSAYYGSPELDNSVVLAQEGYNNKNELELKSETKEVNLGYKHTMLTTGYSFRQMNFNQAGGQQKK
jgi:competence protein ComGC